MHISPQALPASNLFQELVQKDSEIKSTYQKFKSQIHGESIPGNHFFEWVGNKTIPERQVQIVHHFKSLAKFNDFHVYVLTDKPMKFIAAESKCDGLSGEVKTITVDQLNKDFYKALKDSGVSDYDKLYKYFIHNTQRHNVGLENQALRSDYYRLALLYTYGGIHSDINISLKELDSTASALQHPLIPLRGKNGLLIQTLDLDVYGTKISLPTNSLIASKKNNPIILSMIQHMLDGENKLKEIDAPTEKSDVKMTLKLHDTMRLWQCDEKHFLEAAYEYAKVLLKESNPDLSEESLNAILPGLYYHVAKQIKRKEDYEVLKQQGRLTARHYVVSKMLGGGTDALNILMTGIDKQINKQYDGPEDFFKGSGFPLPDNKPSYGDIKPLGDPNILRGLGSWYGKPNPHYVDDSNM
ncbi:glycosyltransferase [Endozoicomonas acroporae]|uniref:glycosyltransferase n=1 Tax=Endozoicomonas acroporae TaxID=1701104 RepID=UPI000C7792FA|nr:glycosyltransferase [Endozoicomonas acroporae]